MASPIAVALNDAFDAEEAESYYERVGGTCHVVDADGYAAATVRVQPYTFGGALAVFLMADTFLPPDEAIALGHALIAAGLRAKATS